MNFTLRVARRVLLAAGAIAALGIGGAGTASAATPTGEAELFISTTRPAGMTVGDLDELELKVTAADGTEIACVAITPQGADIDTTSTTTTSSTSTTVADDGTAGGEFADDAVVMSCAVEFDTAYEVSVVAPDPFSIDTFECTGGSESSRSGQESVSVTLTADTPAADCALDLVAPLTVQLTEFDVNNSWPYIGVTDSTSAAVPLSDCDRRSIDDPERTEVTYTYWYCDDPESGPYEVDASLDRSAIAVPLAECDEVDGAFVDSTRCRIEVASPDTYPALVDSTTTTTTVASNSTTTTTTRAPYSYTTTTTTRPSYSYTTTTTGRSIPNIGADRAPETALIGVATMLAGFGLLTWSRRRTS